MTSRKNILAICSWYPNKNAPTLGNFVEKHLEAISIFNNIRVIGIFPHSKNKFETIIDTHNAIKSYLVYYPEITTRLPILKQFNQWRVTKKAFQLAIEAFQRENNRPDLLHLHIAYPTGFHAIQIKKKWKLPLITTEHTSLYHMRKQNIATRIAQYFSVRTLKKSDIITTVSQNLKNVIQQRFKVKTPIQVIANVVNEEIFSQQEIVIPKKTEFLHVSSAVDFYKNLSGIIRSIHQLLQQTTDFHFTIISDGNLKPFIQQAEALKIPKEILTFEGTKSTEEIARAMNNSTAFVLFSNYENLPCVILESLMVGKPVISTNINGIPEHINEKNGVLIEKNDEKELTAAMLAFIHQQYSFNNEAIREEAIQQYSYTAIGRQFDLIYRQLFT